MNTKPDMANQAKKNFNWGISSTTIEFMQSDDLQRARDGSANDCSQISPVPQIKRKPLQRKVKG